MVLLLNYKKKEKSNQRANHKNAKKDRLHYEVCLLVTRTGIEPVLLP